MIYGVGLLALSSSTRKPIRAGLPEAACIKMTFCSLLSTGGSRFGGQQIFGAAQVATLGPLAIAFLGEHKHLLIEEVVHDRGDVVAAVLAPAIVLPIHQLAEPVEAFGIARTSGGAPAAMVSAYPAWLSIAAFQRQSARRSGALIRG